MNDKVLYIGFNVNISSPVVGNNDISNDISIEVFNFINYLKAKYGNNGLNNRGKITDINRVILNIVSVNNNPV